MLLVDTTVLRLVVAIAHLGALSHSPCIVKAVERN